MTYLKRGAECSIEHLQLSSTEYWQKLTAVLRNVDIYAELRDSAAWKVGHAAVGGQIPKLHVNDLQAAGAGRHVRVTA